MRLSFLSVRPTFVDRLLDGTKTVELRRVRPTAHVGQRVLIYGSSPKKSLMAWAIIDNLEYGPVQDMWRRVCDSAGIRGPSMLRTSKAPVPRRLSGFARLPLSTAPLRSATSGSAGHGLDPPRAIVSSRRRSRDREPEG